MKYSTHLSSQGELRSSIHTITVCCPNRLGLHSIPCYVPYWHFTNFDYGCQVQQNQLQSLLAIPTPLCGYFKNSQEHAKIEACL